MRLNPTSQFKISQLKQIVAQNDEPEVLIGTQSS